MIPPSHVTCAVKVLTFLTMPVDSTSAHPQKQAELQRRVKEAFLAVDAVAVVVALLADPLARHPRMSEKVGAGRVPYHVWLTLSRKQANNI
jgi:hypothetical protein